MDYLKYIINNYLYRYQNKVAFTQLNFSIIWQLVKENIPIGCFWAAYIYRIRKSEEYLEFI